MHLAGRSGQKVRWRHGARETCPLSRAGSLGDQPGRVRAPQYDGARNLIRRTQARGWADICPPEFFAHLCL